jgi:hypothetical protein
MLYSCNSNVSLDKIKGIWEIHDYIITDKTKANEKVIEEARSLLKSNDNNLMFFSDSEVGSIMPSGDTLAVNPYVIENDQLIIGEMHDAATKLTLKDKNTLHFEDDNEGLIIVFKRKK